VLALFGWMCGLAWGVAQSEEPVRFNRDIRPILSNNCFHCHGPDPSHREADLRLDVREAALAHKAIVPGNTAESELVARILSDDEFVQMPPPDSHKKLTAEQKSLLQRWIAEGAEYEGHWSYLPPQRVEVPADTKPIDYLVGLTLAKHNLQPSPQADRRTLIRRLYQDLVGLPPSPDELEAFVQDKSPDAYQKLVEKLLASPHYGERMAIPWLDVVRFADTIGYHSDNPHNVWPYRDYVIKSFNENKPFDQFTIEQLAGDLLPNATQEQKVGSAFNRLLLSTEEGGAQAKDYEYRMLGDRVRAVGAVWLGQTIGCSQCHDHKFDPTSQHDFYALGAFFADLQEPILGRREPGMLVMSDEQQAELVHRQEAVKSLEQQLDQAKSREDVLAALDTWAKRFASALAPDAAWTVVKPSRVTSDESGLKFTHSDSAETLVSGKSSDGTAEYQIAMTLEGEVTGLRLEVLPHESLPARGPGRAGNGNFVLNEVRLANAAGEAIAIAQASASYEQSGFPAAQTFDGKTESGNGWAVNGAQGKSNAIYWKLAKPIAAGEYVLTLIHSYGTDHEIGHFRLAATSSLEPLPGGKSDLPQPILAILQTSADKRSEAQRRDLLNHFVGQTELLAPLRAELEAAKKSLADYEAGLPRVIVSNSMNNPRTVRLLPRGDWMNQSGPTVEPALPHYLPHTKPMEDRRLNRLDLARWIVSRENPLTARVTVNRIWKQFFGRGLSDTIDDLGSQGQWPSHPELLDWLAIEFVDSGWDVKHLVRTIVNSETYKQSSLASADLQTLDPENRLLARQGRWRLDAELVRDNALEISGLLVPTIGGPSVKPYQPEGYWENLNFPRRTYQHSTGEDQYRRGLYTWWQRSFLHPSMVALDAPSREECAASRNRSNIPQQALVLLNDPTYVEAARTFAERIVSESEPTTDARLAYAWQQALQRAPREEELALVRPLVEKHLAYYEAHPEQADQLLSVGLAPVTEGLNKPELAAWTSLARVLLNLHETVTRY
jgi:hypothetical protein